MTLQKQETPIVGHFITVWLAASLGRGRDWQLQSVLVILAVQQSLRRMPMLLARFPGGGVNPDQPEAEV